MARKPNMWSASAAVGDSELRGIPEGRAPERDGTVELPRSTGTPSPSVYSVGKLGGAHRRSDRSSGSHTVGRGSSSGRDSSGRGQSIIGRASAAWTSVQPSGEQPPSRTEPTGAEWQDAGQPPNEWTSTGSPYLTPPHAGPPYIDPPHAGPPYIDPPHAGPPYIDPPPFPGAGGPGYPSGAYPTSGYPVSGHRTGSYPTSGHQTGSYPTSGYPTSGNSGATSGYPTSGTPSASRDGRRGGSHKSARGPSGRRPVRYTGSRRRFSGWAPLAGGALMLALVLGATTMAEAGRYSDDTGTASSGSAPAAAANPTSAASAAPTQATDNGPAQAVAAALNKEFDNLGCGRVAVDQSLVTAAQKQVDDMVANNGSGKPDTSGTLARAKTAGYTGTEVAESVVTGAGTPAQAAQLAFPAPGTTPTVPSAVEVVTPHTLSCGWTSVGAQAQLSGGQVTFWSIVLGR